MIPTGNVGFASPVAEGTRPRGETLNATAEQPNPSREALMNIVVCVKYVPDAQADRRFTSADNTTDRSGVDGLLSELDEYAVEEALKLAEASDGKVTVLTVGP